MHFLEYIMRFAAGEKRRNGDGDWHVRCPAHDDAAAPTKFSLHVTRGSDRILLHCFAGCAPEAVVAAGGLSLADLYYATPWPRPALGPNGANGASAEQDPQAQRAQERLPPPAAPAATLANFADLKQIPRDFLEAEGWRDDAHGLAIPYRLRDGTEWRVRNRTSLQPGSGFKWDDQRGRPLIPYGRHRLDQVMEKGELLLVEGESDAVTAWFHGLPCLGIPGARAAKVLEAEDLVGIERLRIVQEPDRGGETFVAGMTDRLRDLAYRGRAYTVRLPEGIKDLSALHCADPERFVERYRQAQDAAMKLRAEAARGFAEEPTRAASAKDVAADGRGVAGPVLVRLDDVTPEPVSWLWRGRIARGKLALIIGDPGDGKSHVTLDVAARITRGRPWPDEEFAPAGSVLILAAEDGLADTVRPRMDRQGGDSSRVYVLKAVRRDGAECPFTLERDLPALEEALSTTKATLLVIDPLSAYLGDRDSYKDAEIRGLLTPLAELAERFHCAILAILHLTKDAQKKLLHRAQGTVAFVAQARTVVAVGQDPNQPGRRLLIPIKNNLGPFAPALAFRLNDQGLIWEPGHVEGTAEALLAADPPGSRTDRRERDEAIRFLQRELADGPKRSTELIKDAKANGIALRTLWRAKTELGVVAERHGAGPWYWMLPHADATS